MSVELLETAEKPAPVSIVETLRDSGLVPAQEFAEIERDAEHRGRSVILSMGARPGAPTEQIAMLVARHCDRPFAHLIPGKVATEVLEYVDLTRWAAMRALPIECRGPVLTVAVADPDTLGETVGELEGRGLKMELVVAPLAEIDAELQRMLQQPSETQPQGEQKGMISEAASQLAQALATDDAPMAINTLLCLAVDMLASDLHISYEQKCLVARFRLDGSLRSMRMPCDESAVARVIAALKVLAGLDITDKRHPQDGRARIELKRDGPAIAAAGGPAATVPAAQTLLARIATMPVREGEKLAVRVLETGGQMLALHQIGFTRPNYARTCEALRYPNGLFLVTGPTGCGKTTTLYAALSHLAREETSIHTIEDPIEFEFPGAYQSQVNETADITFPVLLRALVRQDPDIILLGEIRDDESAQTALLAALSGRLVLSSLHANSACTAVTRLIDMGVEPFVLGSCVRAIIGQRLVRKLCSCKRPVFRMSERHVRIKERLGITGSSLCEPVGCPRCFYTGFSGRIAVHELLTLDRELGDLVMHGCVSNELLDAARRQGFQVMAYDGFSKVFSGLTTAAEVERQVGPAPGLET